MKKLYIVTDLGPGDGGKGGVVHKISHLRQAHTIVKGGGAQGSHGVSTSAGKNFAFSQFGCATFEGVRTYLSPRFIAAPEAILNEGDLLRFEHGVHDIFDMITMHEDVICASGYHRISSRIKELALKENARGTIGTGVGEAFRFSELSDNLTIRAKHLNSADLKDRLAAIREQVISDLTPLIEKGFLDEDREDADNELWKLHDPGYLDFVVSRFQLTGKEVRITDQEYFQNNVLARDGVIVLETSHGVLTDHYQGFSPHTSAIRTLPRFYENMLDDAEYDGEIINIGVTRAYQIRHGAGPMPTSDDSLLEHLIPGSHKPDNRYQGQVRVGPLDLKLLRYAIACCGGPDKFDGLAITWFDQILKNGAWQICNQYQGNDDLDVFTPQGELRVRSGTDSEQIAHQQKLSGQLKNCTPVITEHEIATNDHDKLYDLCAEVLQNALGVGVRMVSFGATERDKICR